MAVLTACFFALLLIVVQPASAHHTPHKLSLDPETATNTVGEEHCVTAKLKEGHGNKDIEGATIRFSVSGANSATGADVTDDKGQATFCYTGTKAGTDTIRAFADLNNNGTQDNGEPDASVMKTYVAGPAANVTLEPAAATNPVGQQHCVTATVQDRFGNPVSGARVVFTVTGVNPRGPTVVTTGTNGQAQFCYTGQNAGPDTIRAFVDRDNDTTLDAGEPVAAPVTKTYLPRGPTTLTLSPATDTNRTGEQHCVTATATNALGPSSGVPIVFTVTGANTAGGTVTTNDQGQAQFCYTGQNVGPDLITAYADANNNNQRDATELVATATKIYTPGTPATVTLEPLTSENTVGTQHCVTAHVEDEFGNPTPGETVVFTVTGANTTRESVTTDQNGNAVFCYTGTTSGLDTIRAFVDTDGDGNQEAGEPVAVPPVTKLYHPGVPHTVTLDPAADTNTVGEEHCVTATAHDEFGNLVGAGHPIIFEVTGANEAGPTTVETDENGQAQFCYTGTKAGLDTIRAFADNDGDGQRDVDELPGTATKTYLPGAPANLVLEPETDTNRAGERHCVTATVTDEFGNPVAAGHPIRFSVSGANPTASDVVVPTDANGEAEFCYTGTKAGTDTITAFFDENTNMTLDEGEPADTATKIYRPGPPATVELEPAVDENTVGERHCVTATVEDEFGNRVEAETKVFFTVTGANPTAAPVVEVTNANGEATFCYTGTTAGVDTIRAVADANENGELDTTDQLVFGVAEKTYLPGPPAKLVLDPKTATNEVGQEHCVTATVTDRFGNPTPGVTVVFSVTGAVVVEDDEAQLGTGGEVTTDGQGEAEFCYTSELPGENLITAYADTDGDRTQDPDEPFDTATKTYVLPESTPNCELMMNDGGWIFAANGDKGTFGGNAKVDANSQIERGSQEYTDHGPATPVHVKSTEILAVVCEGNNRATVWGTATMTSDSVQYASGTFPFRVSVMDSGEPGRADTYDILVGNGYYSGANRPLQGGNIQIHRSG
jgi:adhesin/invasin